MRAQTLVRHVRAFGPTGADQVLSALSNVVIAVAVGRYGGASSLGSYSIAFAVYVVVLGFSRNLVSEPKLVTPVDLDGTDRTEECALTSLALYALGAASVVGILAVLLQRDELLILAVVIPGLCIQDGLRFTGFRKMKPSIAIEVDAIWVILSLLSWPILAQDGSPEVAVALWGAGALAASIVGLLRERLRPASLRDARTWWTSRAGAFGGYLSLESIAFIIGYQVTFVVIGLLTSDQALGELRAAQILVAPALILLTALNVFFLPRIAQGKSTAQMSPRTLSELGAGLGLGIVLITYAIGSPVAGALFADRIPVSQALLLPVALQVALTGAATGLVLDLKAAKQGRPIALSRVLAAAVGAPLALVAAWKWGIIAAAWALAFQTALYLVAMAAHRRAGALAHVRQRLVPSARTPLEAD